MSTVEPLVNIGDNTKNPTKSPCDPYVFNTVLTRAKSLVVVVGCPSALLGIEKHMVQIYGEKGKCWSTYMKKCLEKGCFIIPDEVMLSRSSKSNYMQELHKHISSSYPARSLTEVTIPK